MSKEQTKDKILELIKWIDSHESKLFRPYDFFSGWGRTLALLFVLLFIIAEIMNFVTASATDRISISLASVAVFMAYLGCDTNGRKKHSRRAFRESTKIKEI